VRALLQARPHIRHSVSFTTRAPRVGEKHGEDYFFTDEPDFMARRDAGEFLEWAEVHGNFYATSRLWIDEQIAAGTDIVLEIDWQGAAQVQALYPEAVSIFVVPPSLEVLQQRLQTRGKDSAATIERRLAAACSELAHATQFQYIIVNQDFEQARQQLVSIADSARCRFRQQAAQNASLFQSLGMTA
jgi:guanylate kinase